MRQSLNVIKHPLIRVERKLTTFCGSQRLRWTCDATLKVDWTLFSVRYKGTARTGRCAGQAEGPRNRTAGLPAHCVTQRVFLGLLLSSDTVQVTPVLYSQTLSGFQLQTETRSPPQVSAGWEFLQPHLSFTSAKCNCNTLAHRIHLKFSSLFLLV